MADLDKALPRYQAILRGDMSPRFKSADLASLSAEAFEILQSCELCSRACHKDRTAGELGECNAGLELSVSSAFDHHGEEFFFVPSFTIFFNHCTFRCVFCQNWEISQLGGFAEGRTTRSSWVRSSTSTPTART